MPMQMMNSIQVTVLNSNLNLPKTAILFSCSRGWVSSRKMSSAIRVMVYSSPIFNPIWLPKVLW